MLLIKLIIVIIAIHKIKHSLCHEAVEETKFVDFTSSISQLNQTLNLKKHYLTRLARHDWYELFKNQNKC